MKKNVIIIPESVSDGIEALQYELNARKDLTAFCIERGIDIKSEAFQRYHRELVEFTAQYELAKKDMEETYITPAFGPNTKWRLDFTTHAVTVETTV